MVLPSSAITCVASLLSGLSSSSNEGMSAKAHTSPIRSMNEATGTVNNIQNHLIILCFILSVITLWFELNRNLAGTSGTSPANTRKAGHFTYRPTKLATKFGKLPRLSLTLHFLFDYKGSAADSERFPWRYKAYGGEKFSNRRVSGKSRDNPEISRQRFHSKIKLRTY